MSKVRVYEYAKQLNMNSKEIIQIMKKLNLSVSNHMSIITEEDITKIESYLKSFKINSEMNNVDQLNTVKKNNEFTSNKKNQKTNIDENNNINNEKWNNTNSYNKPKDNLKPNLKNENRLLNKKTSNEEHNKVNNTLQDDNKLEEELLIDNERLSKIKKKTKSNQKRFDDNKLSNNKKIEATNNLKKDKKNNTQKIQVKDKPLPKKIVVEETKTVGELAKILHKEPSEIIKKLLFLGVMATINQEIDFDTITLIASDYGVEVEKKIVVNEVEFETIEEINDEKSLEERPPVVTIMGHVDHGKTTLLDAIRSSNVVEGEAGGITQHIGAYQVTINDKKITFLDTPGHEAFTAMRARGALITDIIILVVAADDGVMPQTIEAINHAKEANVPIIVAINKMDKPDANPDRVKQELAELGIIPEEWGGDNIFVPISAKTKKGINELLEMILIVAEMQELKANPHKRARGIVIEAKLDKGKGPVATVLIQSGTLKIGDTLVIGSIFGKIRAMNNDRGRKIKDATPSTPVEIIGLHDVPNAGDHFMVFEDEKKARSIAEARGNKLRQSLFNKSSRVTLDDLYKKIQEGEIKELNVIIKGDVQGSVEAIKGSLEKINISGVRVKIIHLGVGGITESDVTLASASNAIIIGFNVRPDHMARVRAEQEKVDIRLHRIIYNVINEIEAALKGMLDPVFEEKVIGHIEVRQTYKVSNIGVIAGCFVLDGKITRDSGIRLIRNGIVIYEGKLDSLKRYKDDAKEVAQGYECGLTLHRFNDIKIGDQLEAFEMQEVSL